ncbi:MAG: hypothetical protein IKT60_07910 [Clostridia bacterium]|nr:hypothetical protein [Clostridia bacterium]
MLTKFDDIRGPVDLGGVWRLIEDPTEIMVCPAFDATNGRVVTLPADLAHCIPERPYAEGVFWFCRRISIPGAYSGKRIVLRFDAVNYDASVFVGGAFVGRSEQGFLPFEFDITDFVRPGCETELCVRVDVRRVPGQLPTSFFWKNCGGILRDVTLYATSHTYIRDAYVIADHLGNASLTAEIGNAGDANTIALRILDAVETELVRKTITAAEIAECEITLNNISPWSPDAPHLYRAEFTLMKDNKVIDRVIRTFGFRSIEAKDGKILLNGSEIFLRGYNRHEDHPATGGAASDTAVSADFANIKASGANFIRMCHYPHDVRELDEADRLGLCLLVEIPLCGYGGSRLGIYKAEAPIYNEAVYCAARECLVRMIRRDRSHPSVILWSVSNENEEPEENVIRNQDALIRIAKQMDPSRLVTHVSNHARHKERKNFFREDDVICFNTYRTIFGRIYNKNKDFDPVEAGDAIAETVAGLRNDFPKKPVIVTEFGYRTCDSFDGPDDEDVQAAAAAAEYEGARRSANGASIWLYADHLWPKDNGLAGDVSEYGLLRRDRSEKKAFSVYSQLLKKG